MFGIDTLTDNIIPPAKELESYSNKHDNPKVFDTPPISSIFETRQSSSICQYFWCQQPPTISPSINFADYSRNKGWESYLFSCSFVLIGNIQCRPKLGKPGIQYERGRVESKVVVVLDDDDHDDGPNLEELLVKERIMKEKLEQNRAEETRDEQVTDNVLVRLFTILPYQSITN